MAKDPKNTNIFSTLGASNHSENERQKEDYYATDPRFINHLIEKEPWLKNPELKILEPSAGEGILVDRFFELTGNRMDAYDLIKRRNDIIEQNYFTADFSNKYDVILTNPPYLKDTIKTTEGLSEYILKALKEVKVGGTVIMFLKTLHLESKVRYEKITPFSFGLSNSILLTETPSRLNLTGFQPGLDWIPEVKFWSVKPKKGEVKAHRPWKP